MFDRFIRLARAKKALHEQRFEDALLLSADPLIQHDRRTEVVRQAAVAALLERARRHLAEGDVSLANGDLERLRGFAPTAALQALGGDLAVAAAVQQAAIDRGAVALAAAHAAVNEGRLVAATAEMANLVGPAAAEWRTLKSMIGERRRQAIALAQQAVAMLAAGAVDAAIEQTDSLFASLQHRAFRGAL